MLYKIRFAARWKKAVQVLILFFLNLCRYDYSGYGQSTGKVLPEKKLSSNCYNLSNFYGKALIRSWFTLSFWFLQPSEQNTYADIEAAYKCLEEMYGAKQEDIILYGQSVGSGPTVDLAARLPRLRAVVLHSPILSGLRVMYPVKRTYWFDIYKVTILFNLTFFGGYYLYNSYVCVSEIHFLCMCRTLTKSRSSNALYL